MCHACQQKTYAFERARSYGIYHGPLVRAIILLKWEKMEPLGRWFAGRLAEMVQREAGLLATDVVVSVPLHRDRERRAGYNQASQSVALLPHVQAAKLTINASYW